MSGAANAPLDIDALVEPVRALGAQHSAGELSQVLAGIPAHLNGIDVLSFCILRSKLIQVLGEIKVKVPQPVVDAVLAPFAPTPDTMQSDSVSGPDARALLAQMSDVTRLHPAQDVHEGVLRYGIQRDEMLIIVTSERTLLTPAMLPAGLGVTHSGPGSGAFSKAMAETWLDGAAGSWPQHSTPSWCS